MVVNTAGTVDSYSDVYPYGMQMPGRNSTASGDTRYKYTGKERDAETGWDYFGARYYDSRIGRWLAVDPLAGKYPALSPYSYAVGNPVVVVDPHGDSISFLSFIWQKAGQYLSSIQADWAAQTGLVLTYDAQGNIVYAKNADGTPQITLDADGNPIGSEAMRNQLISMIDNVNKVEVFLTPGYKSRTATNSVQIGLCPEQINAFIQGTSANLDSRTMGWGMTLMHELLHTSVAGGLTDGSKAWGIPGPVEDKMNLFREQLGESYGTRVSYAALEVHGISCIPMAPIAFQQLNNIVPAIPNAYVVTFTRTWKLWKGK